MFDSFTFKANARTNFRRNYWPYVLVLLVLTIASGADLYPKLYNIYVQVSQYGTYSTIITDPALFPENYTPIVYEPHGLLYEPQSLILTFLTASAFVKVFRLLLNLLVLNPYEVGTCRFLLENQSAPASFSRVGYGFTQNYGNVVLVQFLRSLYTALWTLLFIIPGIVRFYGYFAVPYIMAENPNLDHKDVFRLSLDMTRGFKMNIFWTQLSFIGWFLLGTLTLGILDIFYVSPYFHATNAEMYRYIRANALEQGIATPDQLPGTYPEG